ncbi:hypothetical protein ACM39_18155 [Chryseobacterium sp. FH2]|uniref:lamin tail domain-containing protein n=1 Tax=Chryseobacterium sp. FH2 TaxID=1674291 RepID=UPI00065ADA88|nr:lamin tail domain-containing protein [Chryseobacterium sp. FH2]KMQ59885.1 hypothetical protein ACM39_18155 [Chryseobacterium sp. FH2]
MKKIFTVLGMFATAALMNAQVTIAQVYANGGNSGATYNRDFVVLFNKTAAAVNIAGWSLQYGSATSTGNWSGKITLPSGATIAPYSYYLVGFAGNAANGAALPVTVDYDGGFTGSGNVNMGGNGKIALMSNDTTINGTAPTGAIDFVGMGTANASEGGDTAPAGSTTNAIFRSNGGCTDTNNNAADFVLAAVAPTNSASPTNVCTTLSVNDIISLNKANFVKNTFVKENGITFGSDAKDVKIYNMLGQVVKSASVKADSNLDVSELGRGNYIVTGTVNNQPVSQKILKD